MDKKYFLPLSQMKELVSGYASGIASDRIMVDGKKVGFMYREESDHDYDGGWRFMAGDETQDYVDEPAHLAFYNINTIANFDPDIIPLLDAPAGSAFERNEDGVFVACDEE